MAKNQELRYVTAVWAQCQGSLVILLLLQMLSSLYLGKHWLQS